MARVIVRGLMEQKQKELSVKLLNRIDLKNAVNRLFAWYNAAVPPAVTASALQSYCIQLVAYNPAYRHVVLRLAHDKLEDVLWKQEQEQEQEQ